VPAARRVFISHAHGDDGDALALRQLLRASTYPFTCSLVLAGQTQMERSPGELANGFLGPRIRWCSAMIVVLSADAARSDWVRWEVTYAREHRKTVVVVPPAQLAQPSAADFLDGIQVCGWDPTTLWQATTPPARRRAPSLTSGRGSR
jgi:hypothetical protein